MCLTKKSIVRYPNQKPWFGSSLKSHIRQKDIAYKSRAQNPFEYKNAKYGLEKAIKAAKATYRQRIEANLGLVDLRATWQGIQSITNCKRQAPRLDCSDPDLPNKLNTFYARFDTNPSPSTPIAGMDPPLQVTSHQVSTALARLNIRKAAGPDGVSPRLLR